MKSFFAAPQAPRNFFDPLRTKYFDIFSTILPLDQIIDGGMPPSIRVLGACSPIKIP